MMVMSGDVGCWCALFGTLVRVSVLSVMWLELGSVSEISSPRWSSVYECQSAEWRRMEVVGVATYGSLKSLIDTIIIGL